MAAVITADAWINGGAALVGALIGGFATYLASRHGIKQAHKLADEAAKSAALQNAKAIVRALREEAVISWHLYMEGIGHLLENSKDGEPFPVTYPATQAYFQVFRANASALGNIPNDSLRALIVLFYTRAMGLLDSYLMNNRLIEEHSQAEHDKHVIQHAVAAEVRSRKAAARLLVYASGLKDQHNRLDHEYENMLLQMDAFLDDEVGRKAIKHMDERRVEVKAQMERRTPA